MAPAPDSRSDGSLRGPLLLGHLALALLIGLAAYALVHQLLLQPLQEQRRQARFAQQAHVRDSLQADLDGTRHFAAAFNALAVSHWGETALLVALSETLLEQIPPESAIVAAGIWPEPRAFDRGQIRHSLYWTLSEDGPAYHGDYNDPQRISYFGEIWYAPLRWTAPGRCHFTRRFDEPFLGRPVTACAMPVTIDGDFAGVTTLVLDPQRWTLSRPGPTDAAAPGQFHLLLDDELQVLRAGGVDAQPGDNLPTLGQRDARFGPAAVALHQLVEGRTQERQAADPAWPDKLSDLRASTRGLSERQAAQLLGRMGETVERQPQQLDVAAADGQRSTVHLLPLPDFGTLLVGWHQPPVVAGIPQPQLAAAAATLGALLLTVLLVYTLSAGLVLRPLRQLLEQLQRPAEDTVLEAHGRAELAALAVQLNQRHERIRELLQRRVSREAPGRRPPVTEHAAGDDGWDILEAFPDAIVLTDAEGHIRHMNGVAEALSGWSLAAARGLNFDEVFHISDRRGKHRMARLPSRAIKAERPSERPLAVQFTTRSGHQLPLSISSGPYASPAGSDPEGVLLMLHDNRHDSRAAGGEVQGSLRDELTGALNRQAFDAELTAKCDAVRVGGEPPFHLLYLDVDQLDRINGRFGTEAGDELLRQLARLIQSDVGERNPVYRLFGDKFGILLDTEESAEAQVTAELLRADAQSWGFRWSGESCEISISIGLLKVDREAGRPVDVLRSGAELCDKAQIDGGGRVLLGQARGQHRELRDDRYWLNNIKRGLAEDRFHLSTQQIKPMQRDLEAAGEVFDTLLLLEDEEGFWTGADIFMPIAESHDMATQLDRWTFERIFSKLQQDESLYEQIDFCLVSVSLSSAQNMSFLDFLMERFQDTGIARSKICIDLDERDVQSRLSTAKEFCQALARAGCRLSLSGATTRPSSYKLIRELPVQLVRFDPMITRHAAKDPLDRLATESLHRIVHAMDRRSMATAVDTAELLRVMQGIGLDYAQGDAVARATPMLFQAQV